MVDKKTQSLINRTKYYWFTDGRFFASLRMIKRALFVMNAIKMKFAHRLITVGEILDLPALHAKIF